MITVLHATLPSWEVSKGIHLTHRPTRAPGSAHSLRAGNLFSWAGNLFSSLVKSIPCLGLLLPPLLGQTVPTVTAQWGWVHGFSLELFSQCGIICPFLKTLQHFCDILQPISSRSILGTIMSVSYKISSKYKCNWYRLPFKQSQNPEILQNKNTLLFLQTVIKISIFFLNILIWTKPPFLTRKTFPSCLILMCLSWSKCCFTRFSFEHATR